MKLSMPNLRHSAIILPLCTVMSILFTSCAQTKYSQCKQIIETTLNIANETKTLSNDGKTKEPQEALQVADAFEEAAQEMGSITLEDTQLVEYRDGFARMYVGMSQATRSFIAALDQKDVSGAKSAQEKLQKLGNTERELVSGINNYCQEL